MRFILPVILCVTALAMQAQQVQNVQASFAGGDVIIHYDLTGGSSSQKYNIALYSSHDTYASPLASVKGDVGLSLAGGVNKEIIWSATEELGTFNGELSFKIRVEIIPLPFIFKNPVSITKARHGKMIPVTWEGGIGGQDIELQLLKNGQPISTAIKATNSAVYNWRVPKTLGKGEDFTFKITDGEREGTTEKFTIKPKPPIWLILSPIVVGGVIIPLLGGGDEGSGQTNTTGDEKLPAAPNPN